MAIEVRLRTCFEGIVIATEAFPEVQSFSSI